MLVRILICNLNTKSSKKESEMPRPLSTKAPKIHLNLSVYEETKAQLIFLSQVNRVSISEMVAAWASEEMAAAKSQGIINLRTGKFRMY